MGETDLVKGFITERDIVKVFAKSPEFDMQTPVGDFMTPVEKLVVRENDHAVLSEAVSEMDRLNIRNIPYTVDNVIQGIISARDLNKKIIELLREESYNIKIQTGFFF